MAGALPGTAMPSPLADKDFSPIFPQVSCLDSARFLHCMLVTPLGSLSGLGGLGGRRRNASQGVLPPLSNES